MKKITEHLRLPSPAPKPQSLAWDGKVLWMGSRETRFIHAIDPVEWKVRIGDRELRLVPLMDDQESDTRGSTGTIYWEGAVRALDANGRAIGRGYLELTGYGARLRM